MAYRCERCSKFPDVEVFSGNKVCPNCKATFTRQSDLNRHIKSRRDITCNHCSRKFCSNEHLQRHIRTIHRENQRISNLNQRINAATIYEDTKEYQQVIKQHYNEIKGQTQETNCL